MSDQHRADTIGRGEVARFCQTPNLDCLAGESVVLANHYCNAPLCVPSRNSLLTSSWPQANGAVVNGWSEPERRYGTMHDGLDTLYDALVRAGYDVVHLGVDHTRATPALRERPGTRFASGRPEHHAMLAERGISPRRDSKHQSPCIDFEAGKAVLARYSNPIPAVWEGPADDFFDLWLADRTVQAINAQDGKRPFAMMVNLWSPHCPLVCPEPYFSMYDPEKVPLPEDVGRHFPGQSPLNLVNVCGVTGLNVGTDVWRQAWVTYLGMVTLVDHAVGRILDALKTNGHWDTTLVWFTADHGEMLGSHGLFQKMCLYESAVRVPCIVKPPGARAKQFDTPTQHLDVAPTLLDYAGAEPLRTASTGPHAGWSLRPRIEGQRGPSDRSMVMTYDGNSGRSFHQRAIRNERYKLIHNHGLLAADPPGRFGPELYDLTADPRETRNCLTDPTPRERAEADDLLAQLARWMTRMNDLIPPPALKRLNT